ncbi:hypothetical protein FKM82_024752 [Ascaphus truei]
MVRKFIITPSYPLLLYTLVGHVEAWVNGHGEGGVEEAPVRAERNMGEERKGLSHGGREGVRGMAEGKWLICRGEITSRRIPYSCSM